MYSVRCRVTWQSHQYALSRLQGGAGSSRIGTTKDIARAALFLASEESSYITGDGLFVSGGSGLVEPGGGPRHTN